GDVGAVEGYDVAVAGAGPALGPHREELDVALADKRERHDRRVYVGRHRDRLLDPQADTNVGALDPHALDLARGQAEDRYVRRRIQRDGAGEQRGTGEALLGSTWPAERRRRGRAGG